MGVRAVDQVVINAGHFQHGIDQQAAQVRAAALRVRDAAFEKKPERL